MKRDRPPVIRIPGSGLPEGALSHGVREFAPLLGTLLATYLALVLTLRGLGHAPAVPWAFLPYLLGISAPIAVVVGLVCALPADVARWFLRVGGMALGFAVLALGDQPGLFLLLALAALIVSVRSWRRTVASRLGLGLMALVFGYAGVWAGNYLVSAVIPPERLWDPQLRSLDLVLWSFLGVGSYDGLFPIVRTPWLFTILERSYTFLFAEILLVAMLLSLKSPARAVRWMASLFSAYGIGLAVFALTPAVGPSIAFPESFSEQYHGTLTYAVMQAMAVEYQQARAGGALNGFGYFVAIPSLHVAAAVLVQAEARRWRWLFWLLLPVNVLLTLSTVLLGYHYVIDVPAGMLLGIPLAYRFRARTGAVPIAVEPARAEERVG